MAVLVTRAGRDQSNPRPQYVEQLHAGGRVRPVVADLQHVHGAEHAAVEQHPLHRRLGIPGEQRPEAPVLEQRDDRRVVDVALWQRGRDVGVGRKQDGQHRARSERDVHAGAGQLNGALGGRQRQEARVGRVVVRASRVQDHPDAVALERGHQPRDVVFVRVAQQHHVKVPLPERQLLPQPPRGEVRIRPAVDQHRGARRRADEDRVTLADVEHRQVQPPVRLRGECQRRQHR
jgi:hypothetical protein